MIGAGYWGKNIIKCLYDLGVLHTVCDTDKNTISDIKSKYAAVNFIESPDDILANKDIKAVAISTLSVTHYKFSKDFLAAGKDVFVEKPLALKAEEGEELLEKLERLIAQGAAKKAIAEVLKEIVPEYSPSDGTQNERS